MKLQRPSAPMAISLTALFVALGGTAGAASVVIKNSSQVKAQAITSSDIKNGSLIGLDVKRGSIGGEKLKKGSVGLAQLSGAAKSGNTSSGFTATEAVRKVGPDSKAGSVRVATLSGLAPGTYAISAKTILSPVPSNDGLLTEVLKDGKTASGRCTLDAAGDRDDGRATIQSPYSQYPGGITMQLTRTLTAVSDITLTCEAPIDFKASDTSIIALKLAGNSRTDVSG